MIYEVPLTGTIEEGVMISSWRRIWELTVGGKGVNLSVFDVSDVDTYNEATK